MNFKIINTENKFYKPFKRGNRLLNNIYTSIVESNRLYYVLSTSKCKNKKFCILTIDTTQNSKLEINKLEWVLKMYTWSIVNNSLKTTENGISYTLKSLLTRFNIKIKYTSKMKSNSFINSKPLQIIVNILYLQG